MTEKERLGQQGFTLVESLLVIIIVILVGFTGYYVWHTQKNSDKTLDAAARTSRNSSPKKTPDASPQSYVVIKEWGVEATYNGRLSLSYAIGTGSDDNSATFSSKELTALDVDCLGRGGTISRYAGDADAADLGGEGKTVAEYVAAADMNYGHVGNYYFFFTHDQAGCGANPEATMDLQQQTNDAVGALLPKLKPIPDN